MFRCAEPELTAQPTRVSWVSSIELSLVVPIHRLRSGIVFPDDWG